MALPDSPSTPLRIALVTNNYTPYCGGVVSSIRTLAQGLRNKGHTVFIITLEFLNNHSDDLEYVIRLPSPIRFMYKKNHMALPLRPAAYLKQFFKKHALDIVHTHHPFLLGIAGLRAAQSCGLPTIFTYHTLYDEYTHYVPFFQHITKQAVQQRVTSYCNYVQHIIAPSNAIKDNIRVVRSAPVSVIPSAIEQTFMHTSLPSTCITMPIKLLCVSRFVHEKNLTYLLDLYTHLGNSYHLTFAGYGELQEYLQWYAYTHLALSKQQVTFVVNPTKKELSTLYVTHHLFLFTSTTDTQGLVLAEAMAAGTPVIALDGPGQRDIVIKGYNGFLCNSKKEMEQQIRSIASDTQLYRALQKGAWHTSRQYAQEQFVSKVIDVYSQSSYVTRNA